MDGVPGALAAIFFMLLVALASGCTGTGDDDDKKKDKDPGDGSGAIQLELKGWIHTLNQSIELKNIGGFTIEWGEYVVKCNGTVVNATAARTPSGERAFFEYDGPKLVFYVEYELKVLQKDNNTLAWKRTLPASY